MEVTYCGDENIKVGSRVKAKILRSKRTNIFLNWPWNTSKIKTLVEANSHLITTTRGLSLSFQGLSFSVKHGLRRATKEILGDLYGEFRAGELTAIMGPSGAGKSSLMNILTGYTTTGVSGSILVNGYERDMKTFCRQSCYILQEDVLMPMLTVHESMVVAAKLKQGLTVTEAEDRITAVLESLNLQDSRKTFAGRLSGGQRKRLAIALELISDPPIMFFDEPTSGLDSSTSKQCIELLKSLAQTGRTIICTIHQPSASLFSMFDHAYFVNKGRCLYAGGPDSLVNFLSQQHVSCPQYHNPADFLLELVSLEEYTSDIPILYEAMQDGRNEQWRKTLPVNKVGEDHSNEIPQHKHKRRRATHMYAASVWTQFTTIIIRNFRSIYRDQFFTHLRLIVHLSLGALVGTLFYGVGDNANNVRDIFNLLFYAIMVVTFTSYSSAATYFRLGIPVLAREHFNKWYSLKTYYLASNLSDAVVQVLCPLLFYTMIYFMTSQPLEVERFGISLITILLVSLVGQSYGYLVGCSMTVTNAAIFGPMFMVPFILFSGFFVPTKDAPYYLQWLFDLSYFKYALHACAQAIFGMHRSRLDCDADYCHYQAPSQFLKDMGLNDEGYLMDWVFLSGLTLLLRFLAYICLVIQVRYLR